MIYILAQTATSGLAYNLEFVENKNPIRQLENRKERERKLFVGKLTMNNTMVD